MDYKKIDVDKKEKKDRTRNMLTSRGFTLKKYNYIILFEYVKC